MPGLTTRFDELRRSFALPTGIALAAGLALGLALPAVDRGLRADVPLIAFSDVESAASLLQTIATVSMSVAGISFSVIVVALQLASQQLGPRVLRTFQTAQLNKVVLALFVGVFIYCLAVLARLEPRRGVPEVSLAVAVGAAIASFAFFVAFIDHAVRTLQASDLIRRIAADGGHAIERQYPADVGRHPRDAAAAEAQVSARTAASEPVPVTAARGGYLAAIDSEELMEHVTRHGLLVRQRVALGDFVVTGGVVADVWPDTAPDAAVDGVRQAFDVSDERTVVQDVAFPLRQLTDVALRALSPGLNDPTTAENAMGSVADMLVRFAERGEASRVRIDSAGEPRFVARAASLNDLIRLGFAQVRVAAATHPVVAVRLLALLAEVERAGRACGADVSEADRQRRLVCEGVAGSVPTTADEEAVRAAAGLSPDAWRR